MNASSREENIEKRKIKYIKHKTKWIICTKINCITIFRHHHGFEFAFRCIVLVLVVIFCIAVDKYISLFFIRNWFFSLFLPPISVQKELRILNICIVNFTHYGLCFDVGISFKNHFYFQYHICMDSRVYNPSQCMSFCWIYV